MTGHWVEREHRRSNCITCLNSRISCNFCGCDAVCRIDYVPEFKPLTVWKTSGNTYTKKEHCPPKKPSCGCGCGDH